MDVDDDWITGAMVDGGALEQLLDSKCALRVLAMKVESKLNEEQFSVDGEEVVRLRMFQITEGCEFLLTNLWKKSNLAFH